MFARCPVIGTAVGGIPDVIRHERTGLLVPPKDPVRLGAAILDTLRHPDTARRRALAAERSAYASHTIDCMGETLLAVYREVISKGHSPS
jgi:glycosyltransferase involved in cell wall biosynthesis